MRNLVSRRNKITHWACLIKVYWRKYLGFRERRQQNKNYNYLTWSFIICTPQQILIDTKSKRGMRAEHAGRVGDTINAWTILVRPEIEAETTWESYVYFYSISKSVAAMFGNIRSAQGKGIIEIRSHDEVGQPQTMTGTSATYRKKSSTLDEWKKRSY